MKIATWNVNGLRAREAEFVAWARHEAADVLCLQEIKATPEQLGETLTMLPEYWNCWHGGPRGYSGVSIHVRREAFAGRPEFGHPAFDVESRVVHAKLDGGLVVTSMYVPNGGKDYPAKLRFLESVQGYVEAIHAAGGKLVLCGDLNVAHTDMDVHPKERKPGVIGQRDEERRLFERILSADLVDVARALDPANDRTFTWWPPWRGLRQKNQGWRIDYVLASKDRGLAPTEYRVLAEYGTSDHGPVVVTFA